jgi:hypothetical protein
VEIPEDIDAGVRAVPVIRNSIGPGMEATFSVFHGFIPFSVSLVKCFVQPIAARLAPDLVLPKLLAANDLALLDQNPAIRRAALGKPLLGSGGRLRITYKIRETGRRKGLSGQRSHRGRSTELAICFVGRRDILDIVRARIVWIGREMEMAPSGPARPPGEIY